MRLIAFYLPQFHPIPENDRWWGKGFTEWTNVVQGQPLFPGHHQPHIPADLGFYDLRLPEARQAQADLARAYGIHGFCYYHYWFNGKRLLERPFNEVLSSGEPDFPFCLCWANENWTRAWDGLHRDLLMPQSYSDEDDRRHMHWLCTAFCDRRYIRVAGKPLFLVYRASDLPDPKRTCDIWRDEAARMGVGEIFLARVESFADEKTDPLALGFDAAVEFAPDWSCFQPAKRNPLWRRVLNRMNVGARLPEGPRIGDYGRLAANMLAKPQPPYPRFPAVVVSWDNSARRKIGPTILKDTSPALYGQWLEQVIRRVRQGPGPDHLVFINAWNEWAEGAHLEPDQTFGRGYLEATRAAHERSTNHVGHG